MQTDRIRDENKMHRRGPSVDFRERLGTGHRVSADDCFGHRNEADSSLEQTERLGEGRHGALYI